MQLLPIAEASTEQIRQCAQLYCTIWSEPPWYESGWDPATVSKDIAAIRIGYLALTSDAVVGFTWGEVVDSARLRNIAGHNQLDYLFAEQKEIFYLSELGVGLAGRGRRIGEQLTKALLSEIERVKISTVTLRTDLAAEPARRLYTKLGFKELAILDQIHTSRSYWILKL